MDSDGVKYCHPMIMDYIVAKLNNETYHLDELVEHLSKRNDITFIIKNSYSNFSLLKCPLKDDNPNINKIIEDIPSYNSEEGNDECITLVYYPQQNDIDKILDWKNTKEQSSKNNFHLQNFILNDIFDCKEFLKKTTHVNEIDIPKRKF